MKEKEEGADHGNHEGREAARKRGSRAQCDDNVVVVAVVEGGLVCCPTTNHNLLLKFSSISLYKLNYNWNLPIAQLELPLVYLFIYLFIIPLAAICHDS